MRWRPGNELGILLLLGSLHVAFYEGYVCISRVVKLFSLLHKIRKYSPCFHHLLSVSTFYWGHAILSPACYSGFTGQKHKQAMNQKLSMTCPPACPHSSYNYISQFLCWTHNAAEVKVLDNKLRIEMSAIQTQEPIMLPGVYNIEALSALPAQWDVKNDYRLSPFKCFGSHCIMCMSVFTLIEISGKPRAAVSGNQRQCVCVINSGAGRWRARGRNSHGSIVTTDGAFDISPSDLYLKNKNKVKHKIKRVQ